MRLHTLKPNPGAKHRRKRLGIGESSGKGKTSGKGHKGQKARSGGSIRLGFEGGQMPIYRQLPKRGFNNKSFKTFYGVVNLDTLDRSFSAGDIITEEALRKLGLVKGRFDGIKILGRGEVTKALTIEVDEVSAIAREKIEKAGGKVILPTVEVRD
jgi:large subunit ribosomal protein L15